KKNLGPTGARSFVLVDEDRGVALAGPFLQGLAVIDEPDRDPVDALDVQYALGGFAPRARHAADHHHAHATAPDSLIDADIFNRHRCLPARPNRLSPAQDAAIGLRLEQIIRHQIERAADAGANQGAGHADILQVAADGELQAFRYGARVPAAHH